MMSSQNRSVRASIGTDLALKSRRRFPDPKPVQWRLSSQCLSRQFMQWHYHVEQESNMSAGQRRLDIEQIGDVTVAKFVDKKILDENNIQVIGNQLFGLVEEDGRKKIILDFSNVEYLSSAALGKLITMDKKVKSSGGKLRLCTIRPDIYEVFAITRLNKLFDIRDDQQAALAGF